MRPARPLPQHLFEYIWRTSGRHQIALAALSVAVFVLSTAPLELQRRIVNDAVARGSTGLIVGLALAYAGVALLEGAVKLGLNVYRGWVSERAVLRLRRSIGELTPSAVAAEDRALAEGIEISMILSEAEPIGGFVGVSLSEPLLQGGILLSVFGYLLYLEPWLALLSVAVFSPQLVFVPLIQRAINRRAGVRIQELREVSGGIVGAAEGQNGHFERVFALNMGIFKLKFSMNFLMNLMHHLGVAVALGIGAWQAARGQIQVGTVVAFVSGLGKVNDPWGDLVNWFREMTVTGMRYRMVSDAVRWLEQVEAAPV